MALRETRLKIDATIVGYITPQGRYLDRARFRALRPIARLRAYLGLVAPASRTALVIGRVCGLHTHDISSFLKADIAHGRVRKVGKGRYALIPNAWDHMQVQASPAAEES